MDDQQRRESAGENDVVQETMPRFKYRYANLLNRRVPCIEAEGKIIHEIRNLDEFYGMFGYTPDASRAGLLPDEFIWAEYINNADSDFSPCIQMHIAEYLKKHSDAFNQAYGDRWDRWVAEHDKLRGSRGALCVVCRRQRDATDVPLPTPE